MSMAAIDRVRAAVLVTAPIVMLAGLLYHPHIGSPLDADFLERLGAAVAAGPTRWAIAHLAVAVGSALLILAFLAIHAWLRETGEGRWSPMAFPFVVVGSVFYALLPAMEFAPLAAVQSGADPAAAQGAILPWFVPTLFTSAVLFLVGSVGFAVDIGRSGRLPPALRWLVAAAIVAVALSRFVPLSAVQFHVQGVAGLLALWPLAYAIGARSRLEVGAESAGAGPVTAR